MQKINEVATAENARKYRGLQDQFIYCLELLGDISGDHPKADEWVNALEDQFDLLNRIDNLEDDRRCYAKALEFAKKRGGRFMVQEAEDNIEGTDCLIGNARAELAELRAKNEPETMVQIGNKNSKHLYELGTDKGRIEVHANHRGQARAKAEAHGYVVRDVNMVG